MENKYYIVEEYEGKTFFVYRIAGDGLSTQDYLDETVLYMTTYDEAESVLKVAKRFYQDQGTLKICNICEGEDE